MKQTELAARVGISDSSLCRYLKGERRPSLETAERLEVETGVNFRIWMRGAPDEIKAALAANKPRGAA